MPNFSYNRLPDGKAIVTCTCGWKDPLGPTTPSAFDPAEALAAASVEHLLCNPSPTTVAVVDELPLARLRAENDMLRAQVRAAEAVRDDAQAQSNRLIEERRRAFATGVREAIKIVEQRKAHYELYRCDCLDRDPGNGHEPGCKGEMMSTHPATFAILDEIYTFLHGLLGRNDLRTPVAPITLNLSEATTIASAISHHKTNGFAYADCLSVLEKIREACK